MHHCPYLMDLWRDMVGLWPKETTLMPSLDSLRRTEWSDDFEEKLKKYYNTFEIVSLVIPWSEEFIQLMRNRLVMGAFRYGLMAEQDYSKFDTLSAARNKLELYEKTLNLEFLVDAANNCLLTFVQNKRLGMNTFGQIRFTHKPNEVRLKYCFYKAKSNNSALLEIARMCMVKYSCGIEAGQKLIAGDDTEHTPFNL
jgi:hypothetical protein